MKSSLTPSQIKLAAGAGVIVVGAAGLGWFGLNGLGEKQAEAQALVERMGNPALASLLADSSSLGRAGRDAGEIQKLEKEFREKDGGTLKVWSQATLNMLAEDKDWSKDPGKWKDKLIETQSHLQKEAAAHNVKMERDFYLGLESYRQKSPSAEEVPGLAQDLSVAQRLVELLILARKATEQYPTTCEVVSLAGPGGMADKIPEPGAAGLPPKAPGAASVGPSRKSYRLKLYCSPETLYEYTRLLSGDSSLFIITDLAVTNEKQGFPLRSEVAKKFSSPVEANVSATADVKKEKRLLEILAGNEKLEVEMAIDFVAWRIPQENKPGPGSPPKS